MKKRAILSIVLLLCVCSLILSSCASCEKEIWGRWETTIESGDLGKVKMVYHFTESGEIFLEQNNSDEIPFSIPFGTYTVEEDMLIISSDGTEKAFYYEIKGDILTLSYPDEPDVVFEKI